MIARIFYRGITSLSAPFLRLYLHARQRRGKEDPARLPQRRGIADRARPDGPLIWLHGASVGESLSLLPLIAALRETYAELGILVTAGTRTATAMLTPRLPPGVIVQALPLDHPAWTARFLDHWRPDIALFAESEVWPNLLAQAQARGIVTGLVNARLSARSARRWRLAKGLIRPLLARLDLCLAQDETQAARLRALGAAGARAAGSLKRAAPPLPADPSSLAALQKAVAGRPLWLAASTHPGEEDAALDVHRRLAARRPGLLTVIAPRHPERGSELAADFSRRGLTVARRAEGTLPDAGTDVYLADTLGEMGVLYRLAEVVFLGGTLAPKGGHNPLEPAHLGCALLIGPEIANIASVVAELAAADAVRRIADTADLAEAVDALLADEAARGTLAARAHRVAENEAAVRDTVMSALAPHLNGLNACQKTGA